MSKILPVFLPFASCGNKCIFCEQQSISGVKAHSDLLTLADNQINEWLERSSRYDEIAFYGGNFSAIDKSIRHSLYRKADKLGLKIRFSTRPDTINIETLSEIRDNNIHLVELGIQSLDNEVLLSNGRPYSKKEAIKAIEDVLSITSCGVQLMTGMYKQSNISAIYDAELLSSYPVKTARIYPTQVLKNTYLAVLYKNKEYIPASLKDTIITAGAMFCHFEACNINVIRVGLPQDAENSNQVLAGAVHHSLGDIIKSFIMMLYMDMGGRVAYSGYRKIGRKLYPANFEKYEVVEKIDINKICKEVRGYYLENSEWYIKGQADTIASHIENSTNNR